MRFNDVNECGNVNRTDKGASLFRFHYINDFYGSCTFKARVVDKRHLPLRLEDDSVALETYEVKKGNPALLLRISKTFFRKDAGQVQLGGPTGQIIGLQLSTAAHRNSGCPGSNQFPFSFISARSLITVW